MSRISFRTASASSTSTRSSELYIREFKMNGGRSLITLMDHTAESFDIVTKIDTDGNPVESTPSHKITLVTPAGKEMLTPAERVQLTTDVSKIISNIQADKPYADILKQFTLLATKYRLIQADVQEPYRKPGEAWTGRSDSAGTVDLQSDFDLS